MRQIWQQINEAAFFKHTQMSHMRARTHAREKVLASKALLFPWLLADSQAAITRTLEAMLMLRERGTKGNVEERKPARKTAEF